MLSEDMIPPESENGDNRVEGESFKNDETQGKKEPRRLSVSHRATLRSSGRLTPPSWLSWLEVPFRSKEPTTGVVLKEATGYSMDAVARGPMNQAGSFVGTAILRLATLDAGCATPVNCQKTVYGMKASSALTLAAAITGITVAFVAPVLGAIVDHTRHRKLVGVLTAILVCIFTALQTMISDETWFAVLLFEIFGGFALIFHFTVVMAYLPDLTYVEKDLAHYTSRFNWVKQALQSVYVLVVLLTSRALGAGNIVTAQIAAGIACGWSSIVFGYAWTFLFRKRDPLRKVPEGSNIVFTGFKQVSQTTYKIVTIHRSLFWFMMSLIFSPESGSSVTLSVAVTYLVIKVNMSANEIGIVSLVMLVASSLGSVIAKFMILKINPLNSFRCALLLNSGTIVSVALFLTSPDRKYLAYILSIIWGIAFGCLVPTQNTMQCTLIPKGQETELMGLFAFFNQILGWLPAVLFTVLNERGVDIRWSFSVLCYFSVISFFLTFLIGDYSAAVNLNANEGVDDKADTVETVVVNTAEQP